MAIEGPLRELKTEDVLQLLDLARKTGVLSVRSERYNDEALVHFDQGAIVFAARRKSMRRLGQQLLRAGKLTERELERALEVQRQNPMLRLGEILLEMGSVDAGELEQQLRFQVEETIYDLMAWDEGYFRFEEMPASNPPKRHPVKVRVESLLMEGARRIDEWTRLESKVPNTEAIPVLSVSTTDQEQPLTLRGDEWEVLAAIDGERDVRQIAADLGRSSFDVAKIVYGLATMGLVEVEAQSEPLPQRELEAKIADATMRLERGDLEEAGRVAAELQAAHPDRAEIAFLAGRALAAQGRMRAATEAFARAVTLDPLAPDAHFNLGFCAARIGELQRASQAWEMYLRLAENGQPRNVVMRALSAVRELNSVLTEGGVATA